MKRQIRRGVFETNSSSVHSMTICSSKEYEEFKKGNMFIKKRNHSKLYTKDKLIDKFKSMVDWRTGNLKYKDVNWENEEEFKSILKENHYCTSEEYWDIAGSLEIFEMSYKTENGEEIYSFGYYGFD